MCSDRSTVSALTADQAFLDRFFWEFSKDADPKAAAVRSGAPPEIAEEVGLEVYAQTDFRARIRPIFGRGTVVGTNELNAAARIAKTITNDLSKVDLQRLWRDIDHAVNTYELSVDMSQSRSSELEHLSDVSKLAKRLLSSIKAESVRRLVGSKFPANLPDGFEGAATGHDPSFDGLIVGLTKLRSVAQTQAKPVKWPVVKGALEKLVGTDLVVIAEKRLAAPLTFTNRASAPDGPIVSFCIAALNEFEVDCSKIPGTVGRYIGAARSARRKAAT